MEQRRAFVQSLKFHEYQNEHYCTRCVVNAVSAPSVLIWVPTSMRFRLKNSGTRAGIKKSNGRKQLRRFQRIGRLQRLKSISGRLPQTAFSAFACIAGLLQQPATKFMKKQCESKFTGGFLGFAIIQNESSCIQHGLIGMQHQLSQHNLDKFGYLLR